MRGLTISRVKLSRGHDLEVEVTIDEDDRRTVVAVNDCKSIKTSFWDEAASGNEVSTPPRRRARGAPSMTHRRSAYGLYFSVLLSSVLDFSSFSFFFFFSGFHQLCSLRYQHFVLCPSDIQHSFRLDAVKCLEYTLCTNLSVRVNSSISMNVYV